MSGPRHDRILLGRHGRLPDGMYSTLAGFVEPGESAEDTVHREIREEAGMAVEDLRYQSSQPWPFPHSLMLGYLARYAGGTLQREEEELDDLAWFHRDRLPRIPPPETIARTLIDTWLRGGGGCCRGRCLPARPLYPSDMRLSPHPRSLGPPACGPVDSC